MNKNNHFLKTKKLLGDLMDKYPYDSLKESQEKENDHLKIIGITGSNGKSTTAKIVHEYLKMKGSKSVLFSSEGIDSPLSNYQKDEEVEIPIFDESSEINALNGAVKYGADYLIIEVNERTIDKGYIKKIPFDIRAVTNIVPEHNTFMYTKEQYVAIKKSFFQNIPEDEDCTCIYDLTEKDLFYEMIALNNKKYKTFASRYVASVKGVPEKEIDYLLQSNDDKKPFHSLEGMEFAIKAKEELYQFKTPLIMPHNALNITLAMAILDTLGVFNARIFQKVLNSTVIPGRDQVIKITNNRTIIVSITCTPHLEILKGYQNTGQIKDIRIVTGSFGTGYSSWLSEYKSEKFSQYVNDSMKWAYKYINQNCDYVYITTNDPAASSVTDLLEMQVKEVEGKIKYQVIADRQAAIAKAISDSKKGDVIFISGRGNRKMFCSGEREMKIFKDLDVVNETLEKIKNIKDANKN